MKPRGQCLALPMCFLAEVVMFVGIFAIEHEMEPQWRVQVYHKPAYEVSLNLQGGLVTISGFRQVV